VDHIPSIKFKVSYCDNEHQTSLDNQHGPLRSTFYAQPTAPIYLITIVIELEESKRAKNQITQTQTTTRNTLFGSNLHSMSKSPPKHKRRMSYRDILSLRPRTHLPPLQTPMLRDRPRDPKSDSLEPHETQEDATR
jgi:hypothetical protein